MQRITIGAIGAGTAALVPDQVDGQCGYCGRAVTMDRIGAIVAYYSSSTGSVGDYYVGVHTTYLYPRSECKRPSLAFFELVEGRYPFLSKGPSFVPRGQPQPMADLPEHIADDRDEAWSCFWGGDFRAAVIMGRAAVQRAVRQLDGKGAGLKAEINDLMQRSVITKTLKEFADETRIAGDDAAHPETLGKIEQEEAKESLDFMDEFLEHTIALPARRDARKQARAGGS